MVLTKTRYRRNRQGYDETTAWWACGEGHEVTEQTVVSECHGTPLPYERPIPASRSGGHDGEGMGSGVPRVPRPPVLSGSAAVALPVSEAGSAT
jgi:hypothetical protein